MPIILIQELTDHFVYMEDDMIPTNAFPYERMYHYRTGMIRHHLSNFNPLGLPSSGGWIAAQQFSNKLLARRFGFRLRFGESDHYPLLLNRCAVAEIEQLWPQEFRHTLLANSTSDSRMQLITMLQNYQVDRGLAVNSILIDSVVCIGIHTNDKKYSAVDDLIKDLRQDLLPGVMNVQGPGFSFDYLEDRNFQPRADFRCAIFLFFRSLLPKPAVWENPSTDERWTLDDDGVCQQTRRLAVWKDGAPISKLDSMKEHWFFTLTAVAMMLAFAIRLGAGSKIRQASKIN